MIIYMAAAICIRSSSDVGHLALANTPLTHYSIQTKNTKDTRNINDTKNIENTKDAKHTKDTVNLRIPMRVPRVPSMSRIP